MIFTDPKQFKPSLRTIETMIIIVHGEFSSFPAVEADLMILQCHKLILPSGDGYLPTQKGRAWLQMLRQTPLPEERMSKITYHDPRTGAELE